MIATENQLRVSQDRLARFRASYDSLERQTTTSDVIKKAQMLAIREQIASLENEISEYESLRAGGVKSFEVSTLLDLPVALIKARISRGLTQTALAEALGVKPQQVQRWEAAGYPKVGLDRLAQITDVLGLHLADRVELRGNRRSPTRAQIRSGLTAAGMPGGIVDARIFPVRLDDDDEETLDEIDARLNFIFGANAGVIASRQLEMPNSQLSFKLPKSAAQTKVRAYAQYVEALCRIAIKTCTQKEERLPQTWQDARTEFLSAGLNLEAIVNRCWDYGIAVIALRDRVAFHGACWNANGRATIVLKQNHNDSSRWIFDLFHEIYHAGHPDPAGEFILEADETSPERRESTLEKRAHRFAGEAITSGRLEALTTEIFQLAQGQGPRLKNATRRVSEHSGVPVGILANLMAHRLSEDGFDWWSVAANLQVDDGDPAAVVRKVFFERANLSSLTRLERDLLLQALETV